MSYSMDEYHNSYDDLAYSTEALRTLGEASGDDGILDHVATVEKFAEIATDLISQLTAQLEYHQGADIVMEAIFRIFERFIANGPGIDALRNSLSEIERALFDNFYEIGTEGEWDFGND